MARLAAGGLLAWFILDAVTQMNLSVTLEPLAPVVCHVSSCCKMDAMVSRQPGRGRPIISWSLKRYEGGSPCPFLNRPEQLRGLLSSHRRSGLDAGSGCRGDRQICVGTDVACMRNTLACLTFKFFLYSLYAKGYAFDSSTPWA